MSRPPINPEKSLAGIILDPQTLERVVPESQRPDGSKRKPIRIRPGFTPQEDVRRFRSSKQQQMDARTLPKGHIIGWVPPSPAETDAATKPMTKSAKKNAKRKEKREEKRQQTGDAVAEDWEDDEETQDGGDAKDGDTSSSTGKAASDKQKFSGADGLADKLEKLRVQDA